MLSARQGAGKDSELYLRDAGGNGIRWCRETSATENAWTHMNLSSGNGICVPSVMRIAPVPGGNGGGRVPGLQGKPSAPPRAGMAVELSRGPAAVDREHRTLHELCFVRCQVKREMCDFLGPAQPADRLPQV